RRACAIPIVPTKPRSAGSDSRSCRTSWSGAPPAPRASGGCSRRSSPRPPIPAGSSRLSDSCAPRSPERRPRRDRNARGSVAGVAREHRPVRASPLQLLPELVQARIGGIVAKPLVELLAGARLLALIVVDTRAPVARFRRSGPQPLELRQLAQRRGEVSPE